MKFTDTLQRKKLVMQVDVLIGTFFPTILFSCFNFLYAVSAICWNQSAVQVQFIAILYFVLFLVFNDETCLNF